MATLVSFWSLFGNRMADLGLIDSKLGLYIKINVNNGQNKFEVHISKNVAKMAILWPKIGQRHFGARASHGHNLAIFHQILTNEHTKMTNRMEYNTKLYLLVLYIGFLAPFLLRGLTWAMLYVWTKNYPQVVGTCSGHHGQLISQNCVPTKIRAEPPPPPPPLNSNVICAMFRETTSLEKVLMFGLRSNICYFCLQVQISRGKVRETKSL